MGRRQEKLVRKSFFCTTNILHIYGANLGISIKVHWNRGRNIRVPVERSGSQDVPHFVIPMIDAFNVNLVCILLLTLMIATTLCILLFFLVASSDATRVTGSDMIY